MILLVDVGNSNINFGLAEEGKIVRSFVLKSFLDKTADEYYFILLPILQSFELEDVIISSVVPIITSALKKALTRILGKDVLILGPGVKTGVQLKVDDPKTVGSDIICDAVGVSLFAKEALIVDLGTATKYIYVKNQVFYGVSIAPGVSISMKALVQQAALLPNVELVCPKKVLGTNTIACMQSGVIYGAACQVDGMVDRIMEELGKEGLPIYATGGLSGMIVPLCKHSIQKIENMTLLGLLHIYELNQRKPQ